jgi:hypothetical protein
MSNAGDQIADQGLSIQREQERMEPLLVPRLLDPVACLDETKAANREFTYFAGVLSIRDSPCMCSDKIVPCCQRGARLLRFGTF